MKNGISFRLKRFILLIKDLFIPKKYRKIFTHLTIEEKHVLLNLSKSMPKNSVLVEIGSYLGASSSYIALGSKYNQSTLFCIDTWQNEGMAEGKVETYSRFIKNTEDLKNIIVPLKGNSTDIFNTFKENIDFIFFDGDHSYQGVKEDWDNWSQKLKKGSIVIFHDYGWAEGVKRVINENVKPKVISENYLPNMFWAKIK